MIRTPTLTWRFRRRVPEAAGVSAHDERAESRDSFRVSRKRLGQDLDRDRAIEPRVARSVDLTHAARADQRDDLIRAETAAEL